jgi:hypothetical protein
MRIVAARCGCSSEYITEGVTGYAFRNAEQLTDIMVRLLCGETDQLAQLKERCLERAAKATGDFDRLWETLCGTE